ncbi:MAG: hypothetical protein ACOX8S_03105 [Christensenellales bacterium]|jgi:hypothetical protein
MTEDQVAAVISAMAVLMVYIFAEVHVDAKGSEAQQEKSIFEEEK